MEFIKKCDYIGPIPQLYINKKKRYESLTGGVLTITLGVLSIIVFIGFGYNLLARKNPIAFISKELNEYPRINKSETFFLFGPHLPLGARFDENFNKAFKMQLRFINITGIVPANITEYEMVPCPKTQKFKENLYNIKSVLLLPPEEYYCIPDEMTFPLEYKFGSTKFTDYNIILDFCAKLSKNPSSCYSVEKVRSMYSKLNIHFIYLDSFIDSKDYDNPIKYIYNSDLNLGNTNAQRVDNYFFRNLELHTDLGWILESYDIKTTVQLAYMTNTVVSPALDNLFYYILSIDNIRDIYFRKYLKLQEVLASSGGFVKFCMIIFLIINNFLTRKTMIEAIYFSLLEKYETKISFNPNNLNEQGISKTNNKINNNSEKRSICINNINDGNNNLNNSNNNIYKINNIYNSNLNNFNFTKQALKKSHQQLELSNLAFVNSTNPFTKAKHKYKKLSFMEKMCFFTSKFSSKNNLQILKVLEDDCISVLNIENMLFLKKLNENQNKLLNGENAYKLFKIGFLLNYLQFDYKEKTKILNVDEMLSHLGSSNDEMSNNKVKFQNYIRDKLK